MNPTAASAYPPEPLPPWRRRLRVALRTSAWLALLTGVALGLYLTLRPSSNFKDLWWIPDTIAKWSDDHGRLRNIPAFALLAIPFLLLANGRRARQRAIGCLAGFVAVTECAQYFIPGRWFEWQDIAGGWAGLLVTWLLFEASFRVAWWIRQTLKRRNAQPARPDPRLLHPQPALAAAPTKRSSRG